jgi:transposase
VRGAQALFVDIAHKAIERADLGASDIDTVVNQLRQRRGFNRAAVAVANKTARIIWAVLRTGGPCHAVF